MEDVVIMHDESLPGRFWKPGKTQEVFAGQDRRILGATVKVAKKNWQQPPLHRPILLLYPSEVHSWQATSIDTVFKSEIVSQKLYHSRKVFILLHH